MFLLNVFILLETSRNEIGGVMLKTAVAWFAMVKALLLNWGDPVLISYLMIELTGEPNLPQKLLL